MDGFDRDVNPLRNVGKLAESAVKIVGDSAKSIQKGGTAAVENVGNQIEKAKQAHGDRCKNYPSLDSLQPVIDDLNEVAKALNDKHRTIQESAIPELVAGALGAGVGGAGSFAALYGLGTVGLSAAGITSGLATAGAVVGGGMAMGVLVLAAPVAIAAGTGATIAAHLRSKQLEQEKERLYKEALSKHQAIIQALKNESDACTERLDYLQSLNTVLTRVVDKLKSDLDTQVEQ